MNLAHSVLGTPSTGQDSSLPLWGDTPTSCGPRHNGNRCVGNGTGWRHMLARRSMQSML